MQTNTNTLHANQSALSTGHKQVDEILAPLFFGDKTILDGNQRSERGPKVASPQNFKKFE
jgi:hypothetical protein